MSASRPGQNKDGGKKKPSANPDGESKPSVPQVSGQTNPMTHPNHPLQQAPPAGQQMVQHNVSTVTPELNANPTGDPKGQITPLPSSDVRQVRENINFHDLSPAGQMGVMEQQGIDPNAPTKALQQQAMGALQGGPSTGPVPNSLQGPFVPPGVENFPDDMAHLTTLMQHGLGPGANPGERAMALNAHALASAKLAAQQAQAGPAGPIAHPGMPIEPPNPMQGPPPGAVPPPSPDMMNAPPGGQAPAPAPAAPPEPAPAPAPLPETQPPAGIPPSMLAGLLSKHLKKKGA